jgi:hypothetical protein
MLSAVTGISAHRVDVAQRIRRRDLAEDIGVIHNRREEIDGVHNRQIRPQAKYSRVVGCFSSDNQIGMFPLRQAVQHVHKVGGAELRRSTRGGHLLREPCQFQCLSTYDHSAPL